MKKLKTFDYSYFIGKSHFEEDRTQNYLVNQPINRYFKVIGSTDYVSSWISKGLSAQTINNQRTIVNIYIVYELGPSSSYSNDPKLKNCLFGAATLTKNEDIDNHGYSGYGIGFDRRLSFSFPDGTFGQNVLVFGVDMSSSGHTDNKKKVILVLGEGPTQRLEHTLTAEKCIRLILLRQKRNFV